MSDWPDPSPELKSAMEVFGRAVDSVMGVEVTYHGALLVEFQRYGGKVKKKSFKRIAGKFDLLADAVVAMQESRRNVLRLASETSIPDDALHSWCEALGFAETEYVGYIEASSDEEVMDFADSRNRFG